MSEVIPRYGETASMKLSNAADCVTEGAKERLHFVKRPREHWRSLPTNNPPERVMREIRTRWSGRSPTARAR